MTVRAMPVPLLAVLATLSFALLDKGAFFSPASTIVLVSSLCVLAAVSFTSRARHPVRLEEVLLLVLALWWLVAARVHDVSGFEPLGASIVAFTAAAAAAGRSGAAPRRLARMAVVGLASASAVVGLVACGMRWYPLSMRGQDLWRLSSTLTYSNAAGLFFGMALVLAMDRSLRGRWSDLAVAACSAGLVATQSRAAVLAVVIACGWLLRREVAGRLTPLALGVLAGLATVAASTGDGRRPAAIAASVLLVAGGGVAGGLFDRVGTRRRVITTAALGAALVALVGVARHEVVRRVDPGSDVGRLHEWRAALDQFRASIWTGVGPDRPLDLSAQKGTMTAFAHNEYLQILAGSGLIGIVLLAAVAVLLVRRQRSIRPPSSRTAQAAVLVFMIGGCLDYTWHLPAVALLAGLALGCAQQPGDDAAGIATSPGPERANPQQASTRARLALDGPLP